MHISCLAGSALIERRYSATAVTDRRYKAVTLQNQIGSNNLSVPNYSVKYLFVAPAGVRPAPQTFQPVGLTPARQNSANQIDSGMRTTLLQLASSKLQRGLTKHP
jgi:hypothetical protein